MPNERTTLSIKNDDVITGVIGEEKQTALRIHSYRMAIFYLNFRECLAPPIWHDTIAKITLSEDI